MLKCTACGGTYHPVQADGSRYFHVCPSPTRAQVADMIASGRLGFPPGTTAADFPARAATKDDPAQSSEQLAADHWLTQHHLRRAGHRDENVVAVDDKDVETIAADGAGVTEVPDPPTVTVVG